MEAVIRRQSRLALGTAAIGALLVSSFVAMRLNGPMLAVSGGDPYTVPLVVDTNPDPRIVETTISAEGAMVDVGNGVLANALTFNGAIPGPEFRLQVGDTVVVHYQNNLAHPSGIHWHGVELDNASDGTPLTQNMVPPGGTFLYKFKVLRPGIFWYHPHHHSSSNQVFKGLYGSIIVTDPNEAALRASGVLPSAAQTRTLVLGDATVCKAPGSNDAQTYNVATQPWRDGTFGPLPGQGAPNPVDLCETTPIDEDGNPRGPYAAGDIPNFQRKDPQGAPTVEGQTVLTNGKNVGGRAGTIADPSRPLGALAPGASTLDVAPGQGLRLQFINAATTRFFRLRLTDDTGTKLPLVRVGGQGGLLDNARLEGGIVSGFDFGYETGEILLDPGDRADVVIAIPDTATGTLTLWTEDFSRTGLGFSNIPTVPVAHFNVAGATVSPAYTIAAGTPLRALTGDPVLALGAASGGLLDPNAFSRPKAGTNNPDIRLTNSNSGRLGINDVVGIHDGPDDYVSFPHQDSARYTAALGSTLELTVTNWTGAHHPFHQHGFSIQPLSLTRSGSPSYTFPYREFMDNIDVPRGYTLRFRMRLDDRPLMDGTTMGGAVGRWVFHCHIFFHAAFGMLSELDVVAPNGDERPYINADGTVLEGSPGYTLTMHGTYRNYFNAPVTLGNPNGPTPQPGPGMGGGPVPLGDPNAPMPQPGPGQGLRALDTAVTLSASMGSISDDGDNLHWTWTGSSSTSGLVYVTVTDPGGLQDQVAFALKIIAPPVLGLSAPQIQDSHQAFGISAAHPDPGDTASLSASGLPAGPTLVNEGDRTRTVSGTPKGTPETVTVTATKEGARLAYTSPPVAVGLSGLGVAAPPTPAAQIASLLTFFDQSVSNGTLPGEPGNAVNGRQALRDMIRAAGEQPAHGLTSGACQHLLEAYRRTDGLAEPPDFVSGRAAPELASRIQAIRLALGCR